MKTLAALLVLTNVQFFDAEMESKIIALANEAHKQCRLATEWTQETESVCLQRDELFRMLLSKGYCRGVNEREWGRCH